MPDTDNIQPQEITDPQLKETASSFRALTDDLFNAAQDDDRKREVIQQLFATMKSFTREFTSLIPNRGPANNFGCPDGWVHCPNDGSCVPRGTGCGESFDFEAQRLTIAVAKEWLNSWIDSAASVYFAAAVDDTMRQRTRELLAEAEQQFAARVNGEIRS